MRQLGTSVGKVVIATVILALALSAPVGALSAQHALASPINRLFWVVGPGNDSDMTGSTESDCIQGLPACSLRAALQQAGQYPLTDQTIIMLHYGTYTLTLQRELAVSGNVVIYGDGAANTIITRTTASNAFRIMNIASTATVVLQRVAITNGLLKTQSDGAGILNNGSLELDDSTVSSNSTTGNGGGIANSGSGVVRLIRTTVSANSAATGGGIYNAAQSMLLNATVSGNQATTGGGVANTGSGASLTVAGGAVTGNMATHGNGGGIANVRGNLSLSRASINGNQAKGADDQLGQGGGLYTTDASVSIVGPGSISNNRADSTTRGGGIATYRTALVISRTTMTGNQAGLGGAISQVDGSVSVLDSTINGNGASSATYAVGGGIFTYSGTTILDHSVMYENSATSGTNATGGAIANWGATLRIQNSTIYSNLANARYGMGGGVAHLGGSTRIDSSTLDENDVIGTGGGNLYIPYGSMTVSISIISGGAPQNCMGKVTFLGSSNLGYEYSGADSCAMTGQWHGDPRLNNLRDNGGPTWTQSLLSGSAAIGKVTSGCAPDDQRHMGRPATGCDVGAFEAN